MIADPEFYFDYFTGLLHSRPRFRADRRRDAGVRRPVGRAVRVDP